MIESFEKLPEDKRKMIKTISMQFFTDYGFAQANTVDIAKACGIAKGSLFHYFNSKKGLFIYLIRHCTEQIICETSQRYLELSSTDYFERLRQGIKAKISIPMQFPLETAFLARAFAENAPEVREELSDFSANSAAQMRELNDRFIGSIEREKVRDGIDYEDACVFIQTVLDSMTARILRQYHSHPQKLLDDMGILYNELNKTIDFMMQGIGR